MHQRRTPREAFIYVLVPGEGEVDPPAGAADSEDQVRKVCVVAAVAVGVDGPLQHGDFPRGPHQQ